MEAVFFIYHKIQFHLHQPISTASKKILPETNITIKMIHMFNQEQKSGPQKLELGRIMHRVPCC